MEEATSKQQLVVTLAHSTRSGLKPFFGKRKLISKNKPFLGLHKANK
jgi:hypothetical protein